MFPTCMVYCTPNGTHFNVNLTIFGSNQIKISISQFLLITSSFSKCSIACQKMLGFLEIYFQKGFCEQINMGIEITSSSSWRSTVHISTLKALRNLEQKK